MRGTTTHIMGKGKKTKKFYLWLPAEALSLLS